MLWPAIGAWIEDVVDESILLLLRNIKYCVYWVEHSILIMFNINIYQRWIVDLYTPTLLIVG